ncbi:tRNA uridine-5-carboxymethylaminomethyl(34) synthesis GTPase MnmE [Haoranjiania flava]|uniref:tRNA modification GTPase MnmE n=1 Tax=Haoranjiania flava TaxID=1856322 RepID=A0AAE3IKT6_9BACT|nr:tRNA uridine-5-carboxymethylaminomethyl(34) synthesis GTPase MnmE [Haoranjiania flava]MCU7693573.1 tRNA uridine-5-carboxymethylaminomethyl(34) synthesis GTPase MnmE [Haoranjiania flava]
MQDIFSQRNDSIVAIATPPGMGAIAVVRVSGQKSFEIVNRLFKHKDLSAQASHTIHYGTLKDGAETLDEVVLSLYKGPHSYTGEDVIEISCHGSVFIQKQILHALIRQGARPAMPGEFTQRAFLNGKLDLTQAEAVGDLIASQSKAAQQTALNQLRGGFKNDLDRLREELINFAALIELELDFSDEDVEFADRGQFRKLIAILSSQISNLIESFRLGNVIKNGVSVAIIGKPNAGKSTLLNALLNEERAIVSEIAGTTRDTIEETMNINGVLFRLIDTAGIREHSTDTIENLGIERSKQNAAKADIILHLKDMTDTEEDDFPWLEDYSQKTIDVHTKFDKWQQQPGASHLPDAHLSQNITAAKTGFGMDALKELLYEKAVGGDINTENTIVTNERHHAALLKIAESLSDISEGMDNGLTGDLLALDIRRALHYLGEITGQVEVDRDILGTIFGKFCIGK